MQRVLYVQRSDESTIMQLCIIVGCEVGVYDEPIHIQI